MKQKFIDYFMSIGDLTAQLSYAKRLQVGAVIVKGNQILASGYNGMPSGWENNCEDKDWLESDAGMWLDAEDIQEQWPFRGYRPDVDREMRYRLKTKPEVLHAEMNALMRLAASTESSLGSTLFTTHSPCINCAKAIYQAGIDTVYYKEEYKSTDGIEFLKKTGVNVRKYNTPDPSI
jgi:dCMP deaminase